MAQDPNFYENNRIRVNNKIFSGIDELFGNYVDSAIYSINSGMAAQKVIPDSFLNKLTETDFENYETFNPVVFVKTISAINNDAIGSYYQIFDLPDDTVYALLSPDYHTVKLYDGNMQVIDPSISSLYLHYWVSTVESAIGWQLDRWNGNQFDNPSSLYEQSILDTFNFFGLTMVVGNSISEAMSNVIDIPLDFDDSNQKDNAPILPAPLDFDYEQGINSVVEGNSTFEDLALEQDIVVSYPTDLSGISNIVSSIYNVIISLPKLIAEAIGEVLKVLFIPSDEDIQEVKELMNEKLPIIPILTGFGDDVVEVLENPEDYVSDLEFGVDFGKAETYWDYGESNTNMMNLSWYLKYRDKVNDIIVGFAWLVFLWNLFGQLPSIISGNNNSRYLNTNSKGKVKEE